MTSWQRTIKNIAMAFAILLAVGIISGIFGVIGLFDAIFDNDGVLKNIINYSVSQDIVELKVDIKAADFTIANGDSFSVESNLEYLTVEEKGGVLTIKETKKFGFNNNNATLTLTIPEGCIFENADIITGAGKLTIDTLSTDKLRLKLGAGEVKIGELNATLKSEIEGGAGKVSVNGGTLCNLDLDMGAGELNLTSSLLGNSDLNYGVGEANLVLIGTKDDYCIDFDKGLGNATVDGESMRDGSVYGTGQNRIDIDGGVGAVEVSFRQN